MFKIAYGAGHNNATSNGIPQSLDPNSTNEWVLNDRVARYFAQAAKAYPEVELLRVDDPAGLAPTVLKTRVDKANAWGADFFLSIHHNAGINGGTGGGLVAFSYADGTKAAQYRDAIYDACMASGGIRGDRWKGTLTENFYVLRTTNMPAVLMEYGFMDSQTDVPIILQDAYAMAMARATMEGIAQVAGLKTGGEELPLLTLPALKLGAKGESVKALQYLLMGYGYSLEPFGADGEFGQLTQTVLKAFQKVRNLPVDGVTAPDTWKALLGV